MHGQSIDDRIQLDPKEPAKLDPAINPIFLHNKYRNNRLTMLKTGIFRMVSTGGELPSGFSAVKTLLPVEFLLEDDTRLEGENLAGGDGEGFTGLRVATGTIVLLIDDELAETGDLDVLAGGKRFLDDVQDGLHHTLGLFPLEITDVANFFDNVSFGHGRDFYHE